jgi:hypothetical protein
MIHRNFTLTEPIHAVANLLRELDRLKRVDAELFKAATAPAQRQAVQRSVARRRRLRRELQRWVSGEVRSQTGRLPIGDGWQD